MGGGAQKERRPAKRSRTTRFRSGADPPKRGTREVRISHLATHLFAEPAPGLEVQQRMFTEAALKPKLIAHYAAKWRGGRPGGGGGIAGFTNTTPFTRPAPG